MVDGPQEVESLALYNGQRTVLLSVQKSQGENTIEVVDGLRRALADADPSCCRRACKAEVNRDNSRVHPRVAWPTCSARCSKARC